MKKLQNKKYLNFILVVTLLFVLSLSFTESYQRFETQYNRLDNSDFFSSNKDRTNFDSSLCQETQDFVLQISPLGCTPLIVRSDLLEEQNVPVFCPIVATKINPLIDVKSLSGISFSGNYSRQDISGVGFYPARAAVNPGNNLINTPVETNIGYAVIVLNQQPNESAMPDFVEGTLTARLKYNSDNAFGTGEAKLSLPIISDDLWNVEHENYAFWSQGNSIRAESVSDNSATIGIYNADNQKISSFSLAEGQTSGRINLPGFYCDAGLNVELESLEAPRTSAKFVIDGENVNVPVNGRFLDNKCYVQRLNQEGNQEEVSIRCQLESGNSQTYNLRLTPKYSISVNEKIGDYSLGDKLDVAGRNIYLINVYKEYDIISNETFIFLESDTNLDENQINSYIGINSLDESGKKIFRYLNGGSPFAEKISGVELIVLGYSVAKNKIVGDDFLNNFEKSIGDYESLRFEFEGENFKGFEDVSYDERGLYEAILLSESTNQFETMEKLIEDFKERYPNSVIYNEVLKLDNSGEKRNSDFNSLFLKVGSEYKRIYFDGIDFPKEEEYNTQIGVRKVGIPLYQNYLLFSDRQQTIGGTNSDSIEIVNLENNFADLKITYNQEGRINEEIINVELGGNPVVVGGYEIKVNTITVKERANVRIIPTSQEGGSESQFNFKIGIEKRAISLTPEQTENRINSLNETINDWKEISESLGQVVSGFKTACLVTGAALTVKNLATNLDGSGIARQDVMRSDGGWFEKCEGLSSAGQYSSVDHCLTSNNDLIEAEVEDRTNAIEQVNQRINRIGEDGDYAQEVYGSLNQDQQNSLSRDDINSLSYENQRQLHTDILELQQNPSDERKSFLNSRINSNLEEAKSLGEIKVQYDSVGGFENVDYSIYNEGSSYEHNGGTTNEEIAGISKDSYVQVIKKEDKNYFLELKKVVQDSGETELEVGSIRDKDGNIIEDPELSKLKFALNEPENVCVGNSLSDSIKVRYSGKNPALVPFDKENGWYAVPIQFDDSGAVRQFQVCNVGKNSIVNNPLAGQGSSYGDDTCYTVNEFTGQQTHTISCLNAEQSKIVVNNARRAIIDAARAYSAGVNRVNVLGIPFDVGSEFTGAEGTQCQDFMSPEDCNILFNVCDPVVCPSSRCDFGGTYKVDDVIQTGIVGGIAMCLPNAQEGIAVPLCLSGIHAGVDGLISVFDSYQSCLQESLETGKTVGICDEIHSVYLCEFIYKQAIPLIDLAIPALLSSVTGQPSHGGGEYLGVVDAWNNAGESVDYFTNYYAANSYAAFNARSTEDIGTTICKAYVSVNYPDAGEFLGALVAPDSPSQFHGKFEEIPFTSATYPPASQYKVFYHIYAGKDRGASYRIRLTGATAESSEYTSTSSYLVDSGYVEKGGYATQTVDFVAPSGFSKLCISVNAQEECGFAQVSTSFAVDYVEEVITSRQASSTDITKASECVSGSADPSNLLNTNIQAGIENSINPEIYNRGIIRVCANDNPGLSTDASRWLDVGYCDNSELRCWLDRNSVEQNINFSGLKESTLNEVTNANFKRIFESGNYLSEDNFTKITNELREVVGTDVRIKRSSSIDRENLLEKIKLIDSNFPKIFYNQQKVELLWLRARIYNLISLIDYSEKLNSERLVEDNEDLAEDVEKEANTGEELTSNYFIPGGDYVYNQFYEEDGTLLTNVYEIYPLFCKGSFSKFSIAKQIKNEIDFFSLDENLDYFVYLPEASFNLDSNFDDATDNISEFVLLGRMDYNNNVIIVLPNAESNLKANYDVEVFNQFSKLSRATINEILLEDIEC